MLPHQEFWRESWALVIDGVRFTNARVFSGVLGTSEGGYKQVAAEAAGEDALAAAKKVDPDSPLQHPSDGGKPLFENSEDDSEGDELVE